MVTLLRTFLLSTLLLAGVARAQSLPGAGPAGLPIGPSQLAGTVWGPGPQPPGSAPAFEVEERHLLSRIPHTIAAGDIDRDGDTDIVASAYMGLTILLRAPGGFAQPIELDMSGTPFVLELADLDGDGHLEILVGFQDAGELRVFNWQQGALAHRFDLPMNAGVYDAVIADLDHDGDVDLVLADLEDGTLEVRLNDGNGGFAAGVTLPAGHGSDVVPGLARVEACDLNGDGHPDLIALVDRVMTFIGAGNGAFIAGPAAELGGRCLAVGDLDADGDPDAVVATVNDVNVLANDGTGRFELAKVVPPRYGSCFAAAIHDLDADGHPEVLAVNFDFEDRNVPRVSVFEDILHEASPSSRDYISTQEPIRLTIADFNGDGLSDVATSNWAPRPGQPPAGGSISILYNRGGRVLAAGTDVRIPRSGAWPDVRSIHSLSIDGAPGLLVGEGGRSLVARWDGMRFAAPEQVASGDPLFVRDLDGDRVEDILAHVGSDVYAVHSGNGSGGFVESSLLRLESAPRLMDFDGDGLDDLLVELPDGELAVRENLKRGRFGAPERLGVAMPEYSRAVVAAADLDGTRSDELIVTTARTALEIWPNAHGKRLGPPVTLPILQHETDPGRYNDPKVIRTADCDGNGRQDILLLGRSEYAQSHVNVFLQRSNGQWVALPPLEAGWRGQTFVAQDFDLDGDVDLAVADGDYDPPAFTNVFRGLGDGRFEPAGFYFLAQDPIGMTCGDFDRDGRPDIAVVSHDDAAVAIHMNVSPGAAPRRIAAVVERAEVVDGVVYVEWSVPGVPAVRVERSAHGNHWSDAGPARLLPSGRLAFEDANVEAVNRYGYRLASASPGVVIEDSEASVKLLPQEAIRVHAAGRPGPGGLALEVEAETRGAATVEVFDVGGRRVALRRGVMLVQGVQRVETQAHRTLQQGVYWVRVSRGAEQVVGRIVVLD